ncbi:MAG: heavy metal-associated domain-containing protein [Chloroflexota bacterium]
MSAETSEAIRFPVEGMTCMSCVNRITRHVRAVEGVRGVRVDLGRELVTVRRDADLAPDVAVATAIEAAGYHARMDDAVRIDVRPTLLERLLGR